MTRALTYSATAQNTSTRDKTRKRSDTKLVQYDAARNALALAKSTDEVLKVRDFSERLRLIARQAHDQQLELDAVELRVNAERRLGQMIVDQRRTVGLAKGAAQKGIGRRGKRGSQADPRSPTATLADVGVDKHLADRARKLASLSEDDFAGRLLTWRAEAEGSGGRASVKLLSVSIVKRCERRTAREKNRDIRSARSYAFWFGEIEDDTVSPSFEDMRQKLEWLLRTNPSSPNLPKNADSVAKVVADALWRLTVLSDFLDAPSAQRKFIGIIERMEDKILRIEKEMMKAHGWAKRDVAQ